MAQPSISGSPNKKRRILDVIEHTVSHFIQKYEDNLLDHPVPSPEIEPLSPDSDPDQMEDEEFDNMTLGTENVAFELCEKFAGEEDVRRVKDEKPERVPDSVSTDDEEEEDDEIAEVVENVEGESVVEGEEEIDETIETAVGDVGEGGYYLVGEDLEEEEGEKEDGFKALFRIMEGGGGCIVGGEGESEEGSVDDTDGDSEEGSVDDTDGDSPIQAVPTDDVLTLRGGAGPVAGRARRMGYDASDGEQPVLRLRGGAGQGRGSARGRGNARGRGRGNTGGAGRGGQRPEGYELEGPFEFPEVEENAAFIVGDNALDGARLYEDLPLAPEAQRPQELILVRPRYRVAPENLFDPDSNFDIGQVWGVRRTRDTRNLAIQSEQVTPRPYKVQDVRPLPRIPASVPEAMRETVNQETFLYFSIEWWELPPLKLSITSNGDTYDEYAKFIGLGRMDGVIFTVNEQLQPALRGFIRSIDHPECFRCAWGLVYEIPGVFWPTFRKQQEQRGIIWASVVEGIEVFPTGSIGVPMDITRNRPTVRRCIMLSADDATELGQWEDEEDHNRSVITRGAREPHGHYERFQTWCTALLGYGMPLDYYLRNLSKFLVPGLFDAPLAEIEARPRPQLHTTFPDDLRGIDGFRHLCISTDARWVHARNFDLRLRDPQRTTVNDSLRNLIQIFDQDAMERDPPWDTITGAPAAAFAGDNAIVRSIDILNEESTLAGQLFLIVVGKFLNSNQAAYLTQGLGRWKLATQGNEGMWHISGIQNLRLVQIMPSEHRVRITPQPYAPGNINQRVLARFIIPIETFAHTGFNGGDLTFEYSEANIVRLRAIEKKRADAARSFLASILGYFVEQPPNEPAHAVTLDGKRMTIYQSDQNPIIEPVQRAAKWQLCADLVYIRDADPAIDSSMVVINRTREAFFWWAVNFYLQETQRTPNDRPVRREQWPWDERPVFPEGSIFECIIRRVIAFPDIWSRGIQADWRVPERYREWEEARERKRNAVAVRDHQFREQYRQREIPASPRRWTQPFGRMGDPTRPPETPVRRRRQPLGPPGTPQNIRMTPPGLRSGASPWPAETPQSIRRRDAGRTPLPGRGPRGQRYEDPIQISPTTSEDSPPRSASLQQQQSAADHWLQRMFGGGPAGRPYVPATAGPPTGLSGSGPWPSPLMNRVQVIEDPYAPRPAQSARRQSLDRFPRIVPPPSRPGYIPDPNQPRRPRPRPRTNTAAVTSYVRNLIAPLPRPDLGLADAMQRQAGADFLAGEILNMISANARVGRQRRDQARVQRRRISGGVRKGTSYRPRPLRINAEPLRIIRLRHPIEDINETMGCDNVG